MDSSLSGTVEQLLVGRVRSEAVLGEHSAIAKAAVTGAVWAGREGLEGDEQGDRSVHGGPEKAIHCYPIEHYDYWFNQLGDHPLLTAPGAFGENFSTRGLSEENLCIGDRLRVGAIEVAVSQGRQPCYKLSRRFGVEDLAEQVQQSLKTGWYFRVLSEGKVAAGDAISLIERPYPEWSVQRVMELLYRPCLDPKELVPALALPLGSSWRRTLEQRIETDRVENWSGRLKG